MSACGRGGYAGCENFPPEHAIVPNLSIVAGNWRPELSIPEHGIRPDPCDT